MTRNKDYVKRPFLLLSKSQETFYLPIINEYLQNAEVTEHFTYYHMYMSICREIQIQLLAFAFVSK